MKLTVSRETFLARLGVAVRAASTRSAIQTLAGVLIRVEDGRAELQATDMELGLRVGARGPGGHAEGQVVVPGRLLLDVVRSLPKDELTLEYRTVAAGRGGHLRPGALPPAHAADRGLPEAAGGADRGRAHAFPPAPSSTRSPAWPAPPRATRRARTSPACWSPPAARSCAWWPPTPTGWASRRPSSSRAGRHRSRRTCRPARFRSSAASPAAGGAETIGVAALENQVIFTRRRRGALLAPRRRPLPELPAAAARVLRARAAREPRRAAGGRAPRRPAGAEERAAAAALLGGRARRLRADAGRGRGQRVAAGPVHRARSSRSASTRSSSATGSRAPSRRSSCSS